MPCRHDIRSSDRVSRISRTTFGGVPRPVTATLTSSRYVWNANNKKLRGVQTPPPPIQSASFDTLRLTNALYLNFRSDGWWPSTMSWTSTSPDQEPTNATTSRWTRRSTTWSGSLRSLSRTRRCGRWCWGRGRWASPSTSHHSGNNLHVSLC